LDTTIGSTQQEAEVIEKVTALFFKRQRLRIRYCSSKAPLAQRLLMKSKVDEVTAMLSGLAGQGKSAAESTPPAQPSPPDPTESTPPAEP
jgi:hypothetical protein